MCFKFCSCYLKKLVTRFIYKRYNFCLFLTYILLESIVYLHLYVESVNIRKLGIFVKYIYTMYIFIHSYFRVCILTYIFEYIYIYMRQYKKNSKFWQGKNIKTSVFRTCILITQNTEQVLRISELLSVIQNSYIYGNHGNLKMELTLPVPSCYRSLTFFRRL